MLRLLDVKHCVFQSNLPNQRGGGRTLSVGRTCLHEASVIFFSSYFVENYVIFRLTEEQVE